MGTFSFWHVLILLMVIVIVFGAGKLPKAAGDLAQGIKNFKQGLQEPNEQASSAPRTIDGASGSQANSTAAKDKTNQG
jgi:sec-independent protein translocase protein TatA